MSYRDAIALRVSTAPSRVGDLASAYPGPTPHDRDYGVAEVDALSSVYASFGYQPATFAPAYKAIIERSKKLSSWLPGDFAEWKRLGDQAQALKNQILVASGAAAMPTTAPHGGDDSKGIGWTIFGIAAAGLGGALLVNALSGRKK